MRIKSHRRLLAHVAHLGCAAREVRRVVQPEQEMCMTIMSYKATPFAAVPDGVAR
jgi:hypothetical protein